MEVVHFQDLICDWIGAVLADADNLLTCWITKWILWGLDLQLAPAAVRISVMNSYQAIQAVRTVSTKL